MDHDCLLCDCQAEAVRERCPLFSLEDGPEDVDLWARTYLDIEAVAPTEPRWLPLAA